MNARSTKRRRKKPPSFYSTTAAEERFLQNAIQNSKLDRGRPPDGKLDIPLAPVFYPTIEDMEKSPLDYIETIRPIAERYGICKVIPPLGWNPPCCLQFESVNKFPTKRQFLHRLQEGISFGDGRDYSLQEYQDSASQRAKAWKATHYPDHDLLSRHSQTNAQDRLYSAENLERDYWNIVETHSSEMAVEYGNDVDTKVCGSGFPLSERGRSIYGTKNMEKMSEPEPAFGTDDYYKESWWNLNNIPSSPTSVLRHVKVAITGINVPWMYFGALFSTFCWHNEDNYLYSINYHHGGAPKQWYGVPGNKGAADGLEKVFKSFLSMKMRDVPDLLHHITTMFSPRLLQNADVPVYKILQYPGEFIVTFPRAFHGGFSLGPNVGEAVNFAPHDWISYGSDANERYRSFMRPAVFSHDRLVFTMANHIQEQTSYHTCILLLEELERVVAEELRLRRTLQETGVRDVSHLISLPQNSLDQLDEASANYDDKRLCHGCKHVCFFSAVACECSQSKVSCLRHSHYMCRCPPEKRYFMIWSPDEELNSTLERVRSHCESLKVKMKDKDSRSEQVLGNLEPLPPVAVGVERDVQLHKGIGIPTDPVRPVSFSRPRLMQEGQDEPTTSIPDRELTPESAPGENGHDRVDKPSPRVSDNSISFDKSTWAESSDDEVEVLGVHKPSL